jgi:predicted MFS family arabinose efflux permease
MRNFISFFYRAFSGIPTPIWWLSLSQLINRMGTMAIPFMTLYLTQKLRFSIADAGFIMMFFGVGTILGAMLGGRLADQIGYRRVMTGSLFLTGVGFLCLLPLTSFWAISFGVFCLSIVAEGFRPACSMSISRYSSRETRTRSFSLYRLAVNLGWTIASVVGGLLASFDYSLIFWADGLTCLFSGVFLIFLFKKMKETVETDSKMPMENLPKTTAIPAWRDPIFMAFVGLTWLGAMIFMQMVWTIPPFFKEIYGFDEWTIGLVMGLNGLIVFAFEMPIIFYVENRRPIFWFVRLGLGLYLLTYLLLALPFSPMILAISSIIAVSFGETFVMPFSSTFVTKRAPVALQGQYLSFYTAAYSVSNVLAPLIGTQIIAAHGYSALWWTTSAAAIVALVGCHFLGKYHEAPLRA